MSFIRTIAAVSFAAALSMGTALAADLALYSDKTPWNAGMTKLAEGASAASGATIKLQEITPTDKYQAFMQTSIAGNNAPAFFTWWNGQQLSDLVATGIAADLTPYWDQAIADGDFSADQKELVSVDGKPYGVLLNVANWVMFYNTEAFEKAGIAAAPTTWAEFIDACDKLKAAGYTPINGPASGGWMPFIWFSQLVLGTNPDSFVGLTDGSVAYDSPDVQNAFKVWGEMYAKGYFTDPREQDDQKYFVDKSAAMFLVGDWHSGSFAEAGMEPGKDFKTFLMPSLSPDVQQSVIVEASPIVVSKAALDADPNLGKAVQSLMGADAANALGSTVQVYNGNLKAQAPNATIEANKELVAAAKPRALVRWWEAVPSQIQGDLVAAMGAFMFDPTPEQAAKSMADMQAINADYWASK
ncbi:MAG TPA: extracellular solute-binding protein [Devosia sp.]|jgi:multiple sugar transport system substrate-binding protein|uniref:ABC transporter substrate-binding protein n=1 Tax=Devosia sp. TaxID=1871048 RepID=UPI002DDD01AD|nr:extracellular solute-binding protein [Devosia sp.]HEV2513772.1 extracellular solute-binding protein [Devosia sp.]